MKHNSVRIKRELKNISWPTFTQIIKETIIIILVSTCFVLVLGLINWLLQQNFNNLLS
ncbi:preprotein translocase subunit SecE [Lactococcus lactis]|uniref:preprotein translocase subunit SecE n=1 Tax=Lactococcus TaxID=1357 RepID=UPI0009BD7C31|nr:MULTISPECIES: preprotein translocase subunit SecE [Lactococcus]MBK0084514.1 preprotein translocase subunit SecE [Lactococcus sp. S64]MBK5077434.1 preprotein translocase subunit SecE [Lactococcus lactis]MDG4967449.1 preprotein translocase subunit SecE [Lactococcus lactis]